MDHSKKRKKVEEKTNYINKFRGHYNNFIDYFKNLKIINRNTGAEFKQAKSLDNTLRNTKEIRKIDLLGYSSIPVL